MLGAAAMKRLGLSFYPAIGSPTRHKLLGQHTPIARQILQKLVKDGRIAFTPKPELGVYEFEGLTLLDKLLAGLIPRITPYRRCGAPCRTRTH